MSSFLHFQGNKIHYHIQGKGDAVVLLHGFLESLEIWNEFAAKLAKKNRVITIDLPGHGKTGDFDQVNSMEFMTEVVNAVLRHTGTSKCAMIGHSMGGYVTLAFAEKYDEKLTGMCLFHSTASADSPKRKNDRNRAIQMINAHPEFYVREVIPNLFAGDGRQKFIKEIEQLKKTAMHYSKKGIVAAVLGMRDRKDRKKVLKSATFPVLFIIGRKDPVVSFESLNDQIDLPKLCFITFLEHSGHMGFLEEKKECFQQLERFIHLCFDAVPFSSKWQRTKNSPSTIHKE